MSETGSDQNTKKSQLDIFIDEVENELDQAKEVYSTCLVDLFEKVKSEKPGTIFFLDRSARPIAWMLTGMMEELRQSEPQLEVPKVRFISLDDKFQPSGSTFDEEQKKYKFDRQSPVMIVDELSDSFDGLRNIDYAGKVLKKEFGVQNIVKHVFMKRTKIDIPRFYSGSDDEKRLLYGIEDSSIENLISKPAVQNDLPVEKERYRIIFKNFGKRVASELNTK